MASVIGLTSGNSTKNLSDIVDIESFSSSVIDDLIEDQLTVELIAVTDFYPLKSKKGSEIIDSEYYDLIKLRIDYFEKLVKIFDSLK
jgi:hypothetical protein